MLEMDRIGADIIALLKEPDQAADSLGTSIEYLEFRVKNMERTVGLENASSKDGDQSCAMQMPIRWFIQLRANHFRLLIQLRSLASAKMAATRSHSVKALVSAADDNVWVCKTATDAGPIPALLRPTFAHFCMAAVSGMLLAAAYDPTTYASKCRRPFEAGLGMLEAWTYKPQSTNPRHRYCVANLRNLGQRLSIFNDDATDRPLINGSSTHNSSAVPTLHNGSSSDANLEHSWNVLRDNAFAIGEMSAHMQPWDSTCFDFVFNSYGAGIRDNEIYPI